MYPPFGTSWTLKTNEWLQFVVKRLQIHASSIHFCLKIKWFHKIFHQTSTHHTLESPEAGGRPRSTTSCIPGLTERFTAHLRVFSNPRSKCWEIMRYTLYIVIIYWKFDTSARGGGEARLAGNKLTSLQRHEKNPKSHENWRFFMAEIYKRYKYNI